MVLGANAKPLQKAIHRPASAMWMLTFPAQRRVEFLHGQHRLAELVIDQRTAGFILECRLHNHKCQTEASPHHRDCR